VRIAAIDPLPRRAELYRVFTAALGVDPASARGLAWRDETLALHAGRTGFVLLAALDDADRIAGFAYGYTGAYGQWWTDLVAHHLDDDARAEWLDPPHFEVVELHVHPAAQRAGIGTALLDALLARQAHDRAVLSTDPGSASAPPFYRKHGWTRLGSYPARGGPKDVLGKAGLAAAGGHAGAPRR
jgi:ribosomal protein S18 acetylase RimI-like enzyme